MKKIIAFNKPTLTPSRLDAVKKECEALIKKSCYASAGAAVIPVPLLDVAIDAGILSQLLPEISHRFGLSDGRTQIYNSVTKEIQWTNVAKLGVDMVGLVATRGVAKKALNNFTTRIVTKQIAKFVPLGGQIVAASLGYFAMRKIATAHLSECYLQAVALEKSIQARQNNQ